MYPPRRRGGPSVVATRGQIRVMERRGNVEAKGWGLAFVGENDNEYMRRA